MAAVLFRLTSVPVLDSNGDPVSGALAYFYETGTLTPTPVYQDAGLTIEHTHPVVANAAGVLPQIYLDSDVTVRLRITAPDGSLIDESDPYADLSAQEIADKLASVGVAFGGPISAPSATFGGIAAMTKTLNPTNYNTDITLAPAFNGRFIRVSGSTNRTWTISPEASNAWGDGSFIIVAPTGGGTLQIVQGTGVTLYYAGGTGNRTIASTGFAILIRHTENTWFMIGSGIS